MKPRFSKSEVEQLVNAPKCIKAIPTPRVEHGRTIIESPVFMSGDPAPVKGGLVIIARVTIALSGTSRHIPGVSLRWHGIRIRGIDREMRHDNPDGSYVLGWHEHLWSVEDDSKYVREAGAPPNDLSLRGVFRWGLEKWNIKILKTQDEF